MGKTYRADVNAHLDFQDRLWSPLIRRKKKLPHSIFLIGNHEQRIEKALDKAPELEGTISMSDLSLEAWYNDIVPYSGGTPGAITIDGVTYAHYFVSGIQGRSISSEHPAYTLISKQFTSCTCGHSHTFDYSVRTRSDGSKVMGLVAGCYQDYTNDWAGEVGKLWDRGVVVKRNVDNGIYDMEWISLESMRKEYQVT